MANASTKDRQCKASILSTPDGQASRFGTHTPAPDDALARDASRATIAGLKWVVIAAVAGVIAAAAAVFTVIPHSGPPESRVIDKRFVIRTEPLCTANCGSDLGITGVTPFTNREVYIFVTSRGGSFIQNYTAAVSADGGLVGRIRLGAAAVGSGMQFQIQAVSTAMKRSRWKGLWPPDGVYSAPLFVQRQ